MDKDTFYLVRFLMHQTLNYLQEYFLISAEQDQCYNIHSHMCLVGPPNPYKLEQSWELTFLIGLTLLNTKLAKKNFFTDIL